MAGAVTADPGSQQLAGQRWSLRAERVEVLNGNGWGALVGVRRGLKLLVTSSGQAGHRIFRERQLVPARSRDRRDLPIGPEKGDPKMEL